MSPHVGKRLGGHPAESSIQTVVKISWLPFGRARSVRKVRFALPL
jgi:hypothetical protein